MSTKPAPKVEHENVLAAHPKTGAPHITVGRDGHLHHYEGGCPKNGARVEITLSAVAGGAAVTVTAGPPRVATEAFRARYDEIDWKKKN